MVLVDPENTSLIRKQNIALTIAHELAHQWFGNLVTMQWWTGKNIFILKVFYFNKKNNFLLQNCG